jgi:hypothetical protein
MIKASLLQIVNPRYRIWREIFGPWIYGDGSAAEQKQLTSPGTEYKLPEADMMRNVDEIHRRNPSLLHISVFRIWNW